VGVGGEFGKYYPKERSTPTFFSLKYRRYIMAFKVKRSTVKKAAKAGVKVIEKLPQVEAFRESLAKEPIETIAKTCYAMARSRKRIEGVTGVNLMPVKARTTAIEGQALNDVTLSSTMYMFRPPRKRVDDAVKYCMKRTVSQDLDGILDGQMVFDIDVLDAKPVKNNPGNSSDYSPISVKKAFDNYLEGRLRKFNTDPSEYAIANAEQGTIHVKSLSSELTIANLYGTGCFLDIYELVPQHNLGPSTYVSAVEATGAMSPLWTYATGLNQTDMMEDTPSERSLGMVPSNSTYWQRTWKVVKHVKVNMTGNSVHRHKSFYEINKTVSYPELDQFSPDGGKFAGWNPTYMIVFRGAPSAGNLAAASQIRYTCDMQLNYEATPDRQNKVIVFNVDT